tara:strand:- start:506 stop:712 length:207 start_codon:yes stop_codon:yes gene_type:complete
VRELHLRQFAIVSKLLEPRRVNHIDLDEKFATIVIVMTRFRQSKTAHRVHIGRAYIDPDDFIFAAYAA